MKILRGVVVGFLLGAWLPAAGCAGICLLSGASMIYVSLSGPWILPSAASFAALGGLWELWYFLTHGSLKNEWTDEDPVILEPPPRKRRGPSPPGRG